MYLQGLLTNDIQALTAGTGCYSAWLTPQGRMITDLHVLESGDMILLDVPEELVGDTLARLDQFLFSEDVQLSDLSSTLATVWVHGPAAGDTLAQLLEGAPDLSSWVPYRNARARLEGVNVVVTRIDQLGLPGYGVYLAAAHRAELIARLERVGILPAAPETIEAARLEAGYPLFGVDMGTETIPLEAGIEDRAISFSKGCYVGQEIIIRVLHRGHGRVAKKLVRLRVDGEVPPRGAKVFATTGEREIGTVTSAAHSPRLGPLAFAYLHRDFLTADMEVGVDAGGERRAARVVVSPAAAEPQPQ